MAEILRFPTPSSDRGGRVRSDVRSPDDAAGRPPTRRDAACDDARMVPDAVRAAVDSVRRMTRRDGVHYREIEVPRRLADWGVGVGVTGGGCDCDGDDDRACDGSGGVGWIMALFDEEPKPAWTSHWRCVAYCRMPVRTGRDDARVSASTPAAGPAWDPDAVWNGVRRVLGAAGARDVDGTVSMLRSTGFGGLRGETTAECEVRVSWTPPAADGGGTRGEYVDVGAQVNAWAAIVAGEGWPPMASARP